jgi:SAM-dependent methyltransferase
LEFVSPRPGAAILDEFYNQPGYAAHSANDAADQCVMARIRAARLGSWSGSVRILDIGCGNGLQLQAFREFGATGVGMEPSGPGRSVVEARGFPVYASLAEVERHEPLFDIITLYHVLEHVTELDQLFASIRRMLKPEGRLCVEVPNLHSLRARLFPLLPASWTWEDDRYRAFPIHLYGFSAKSLKAMLLRYGWRPRIVMTSGFGIDRGRKKPPAGGGILADLSVTPVMSRRPVWRRLARTVWRQFERVGLGENLTMIAAVGNQRSE